MFSIIQPYIQIPNIYLGLGFEYGPQRIRDLAIVCPTSVTGTKLAKKAGFSG
jgi:hypothetical protein